MKFYIYCLEFDDGSYYIGQTKNLKRRIQGHSCKHGRCFNHFILDEATTNNVLLRECMWIQLFASWSLRVINKRVWTDINLKQRVRRIGRPKAKDPKVQLRFYPLTSDVNKLGIEEVKRIALEAIRDEAIRLGWEPVE